MLVEGRALERPQRVLEERIHDDRGDQVRLGLLGGGRRAVTADDLGRRGALSIDRLPRQLPLIAQRAPDGRERFGAADDRDVELPLRDPRGEATDEHLRAVAPETRPDA